MAITIILFILGFVFLIKGADIMVDGSSSIAKKYGISNLVIGLTIVAFGTSAPELVVSALASFKGSSDIALGNIIGSNLSNSLLILGISAIICPLLVKKSTIKKEIPFSLLAVFAVGILANDFLIDHNSVNSLTRIDGLILILFFSIFIFYTFGIAKPKEGIVEGAIDQLKQKSKEINIGMSVSMIIVGLAGLAIGGKLIVDGAVVIAQSIGMSEALIGLTIIAIGTSLPELAASSVAAYRGKTDIAVGNVVGSNIFNLLWVLGASAIIHPISYNMTLNVDVLLLLGVTILLLFLIYLGKKNILGKWEGVSLVILYVCYLGFLVYRG